MNFSFSESNSISCTLCVSRRMSSGFSTSPANFIGSGIIHVAALPLCFLVFDATCTASSPFRLWMKQFIIWDFVLMSAWNSMELWTKILASQNYYSFSMVFGIVITETFARHDDSLLIFLSWWCNLCAHSITTVITFHIVTLLEMFYKASSLVNWRLNVDPFVIVVAQSYLVHDLPHYHSCFFISLFSMCQNGPCDSMSWRSLLHLCFQYCYAMGHLMIFLHLLQPNPQNTIIADVQIMLIHRVHNSMMDPWYESHIGERMLLVLVVIITGNQW